MQIEHWPFKTIEKHDAELLRSCQQRAKPDDIIIHVGDLESYGKDRHDDLNRNGLTVNQMRIIKDI